MDTYRMDLLKLSSNCNCQSSFIDPNGNNLFLGFSEKALVVFGQMLVAGLKPHRFTFWVVVPACSLLSFVAEGVAIHGEVIRRYRHNGLAEDTRELFKQMQLTGLKPDEKS
ncbi:hypothetical protein SUGI_0757410 [Cryptomeria japonica]|nr:hypothetical protein SUGI_0757410 [Cryptomeria japonica]